MKADTPAFALAGVGDYPPSSFTGTRGWEFSRAGNNQNIYITQLGVFDSGGDGLSNAHEVGLWIRGSYPYDGVLLASAVVPAGTSAPFSAGYRWVDIAPVAIPYDLTTYIVGAHYVAGDADALVAPIPSTSARDVYLKQTNGRLSYGSSLSYPAGITMPPSPEATAERFFEANFQYSYTIPEPATWRLLVPACWLVLLRRRRNVQ